MDTYNPNEDQRLVWSPKQFEGAVIVLGAGAAILLIVACCAMREIGYRAGFNAGVMHALEHMQEGAQ